MQFLEHPDLSRLSVLINELDVGDRILCGKLELFSTDDPPLPIRQETKNELVEETGKKKKKPLDPEKESHQRLLGCSDDTLDDMGRITALKGEMDKTHPMSFYEDSQDYSCETCEKGQELLFTLVTTLNKCFPDYDFSCVRPDIFVRIKDPMTVYTSVNYYLSFFAERVVPGLLNQLWGTICDVIDLTNTVVYSYTTTQGSIQSNLHWDDGGCLFSFDYFFVDVKQHRVLFFACMTKRKQWVASETNSSYNDNSKSDTSCLTSRTNVSSFENSASDDDEEF